MKNHIVFACLTLFTLSSFSLFAQTTPGFKGPHLVSSREVTFTDNTLPANNQTIKCRIYYPAPAATDNQPVSDGQFPVVAFGHGFNMNYLDYKKILTHLSSWGFITVTPDVQNGFNVNHETFAKQLAACIKYLQAQGQTQGSPFFERTTDKSGCFGHSMGGGSTYLVPSVFPQITAISGMAPANTNPSCIAVLPNIQCPFQVISGSEDNTAGETDNQIPMYNAAPTLKQWVSITGGAHCKFSDSNTICDLVSGAGSITREKQIALSAKYVTAFFRHTLKDENMDLFLCGDSILADKNANNIKYQTTFPCTGCNITTTASSSAPGFCAGQSVTLQAQATQANVFFLWKKGGEFIPNANTPSYVASEPGTYTVVATAPDDCSAESEPITVVLYPTPDVPIIELLEPLTLKCTLVAASYQWYLNDNAIPGANQQTYTASVTGNYSVRIKNIEGCESPMSSAIELIINNRNDGMDKLTIKIFPNPTTGLIHFEGSVLENIQIFDTNGKNLPYKKINAHTISLENLPAGNYLLKAKDFSTTIIKQ